MTLALEFNDAFDLTAIGTLALAVVTAVSLAFGWKSLRQGQKEVEEAHRAVLIPLADTVKRIQRAISARSRPSLLASAPRGGC